MFISRSFITRTFTQSFYRYRYSMSSLKRVNYGQPRTRTIPRTSSVGYGPSISQNQRMMTRPSICVYAHISLISMAQPGVIRRCNNCSFAITSGIDKFVSILQRQMIPQQGQAIQLFASFVRKNPVGWPGILGIYLRGVGVAGCSGQEC